MSEIDVDVRDESVLRFVLSLPTDPNGTRLRVNGKTLFRVIPVLPSDSTAEQQWTDEQNARRCLLINKVFCLSRIWKIAPFGGVLRAYYGHVQQTTYILHNKGSAEQVLYLEHPRQAKEWKLFDTAEPREITENHWRFCFPLPGAKTSRFAVRQKRVLERLFVLTDVKEGQLSFWLEERHLDQKTAKVLGDVLALRQEAGKHEEQTAHLEKEGEQIHNEQKRIRENLQALGDRPSEKGSARALGADAEHAGRPFGEDRRPNQGAVCRARALSGNSR